jgi:hypothetical protein
MFETSLLSKIYHIRRLNGNKYRFNFIVLMPAPCLNLPVNRWKTSGAARFPAALSPGKKRAGIAG